MIVAKPRIAGMAASLRKGDDSRLALFGPRDNLPAIEGWIYAICSFLYNEDEDGLAAPKDVVGAPSPRATASRL
jgi:hypothetical protein